jgi:hypothetical protein
VAETLRTIAAYPTHLGADVGFFAVLHTWGSTLVHHPHLHATGDGDLLEEYLGLRDVPRAPVPKAPLQGPRLPG